MYRSPSPLMDPPIKESTAPIHKSRGKYYEARQFMKFYPGWRNARFLPEDETVLGSPTDTASKLFNPISMCNFWRCRLVDIVPVWDIAPGDTVLDIKQWVFVTDVQDVSIHNLFNGTREFQREIVGRSSFEIPVRALIGVHATNLPVLLVVNYGKVYECFEKLLQLFRYALTPTKSS